MGRIFGLDRIHCVTGLVRSYRIAIWRNPNPCTRSDLLPFGNGLVEIDNRLHQFLARLQQQHQQRIHQEHQQQQQISLHVPPYKQVISSGASTVARTAVSAASSVANPETSTAYSVANPETSTLFTINLPNSIHFYEASEVRFSRTIAGFGFHDVVIESPLQSIQLSDLDPVGIGDVLIAYRKRLAGFEAEGGSGFEAEGGSGFVCAVVVSRVSREDLGLVL
ncbi:unnamed protein product [Microthlaspi erraticum]|uniref:Uncharacterized protein n=1 Tax=Microthlaspi erraticum TaxID=1685480 RepID=A0A6D2KVL5_9BRAS|nr:unnamed protein product [Microthlaspi erraticum]